MVGAPDSHAHLFGPPLIVKYTVLSLSLPLVILSGLPSFRTLATAPAPRINTNLTPQTIVAEPQPVDNQLHFHEGDIDVDNSVLLP